MFPSLYVDFSRYMTSLPLSFYPISYMPLAFLGFLVTNIIWRNCAIKETSHLLGIL